MESTDRKIDRILSPLKTSNFYDLLTDLAIRASSNMGIVER